MTHVYFDASGLAKRYVREPGTTGVNHVFARVPPARMSVLGVGAGEVVSILVRHRNGRRLSPAAYTQALANFRAEIFDRPEVIKVEADAAVIERSLALIDRHSVNATDALILRTALDLLAVLWSAGHDLLLVASDQRLMSAAGSAGLPTFDPEREPTTAFDALFTP